MMKSTISLILAFSLTTAAHADNHQQTPSLSDSHGWLIGTWEATDPTATSGSEKTTMQFRWGAGEQVILLEGEYVAEEASWSYAAVFFYDSVMERFRVFTFNSNGRRHLGLLTKEPSDTLVWKMHGLLPDGRRERFVMEFVPGEDDTLTFHLRDREPNDDGSDSTATVEFRRVSADG
jgi:hypothetical protein